MERRRERETTEGDKREGGRKERGREEIDRRIEGKERGEMEQRVERERGKEGEGDRLKETRWGRGGKVQPSIMSGRQSFQPWDNWPVVNSPHGVQ